MGSQHQQFPLSCLTREEKAAGSQEASKRSLSTAQKGFPKLTAKPQGRTTLQTLLIQHTVVQIPLPTCAFSRGALSFSAVCRAYPARTGLCGSIKAGGRRLWGTFLLTEEGAGLRNGIEHFLGWLVVWQVSQVGQELLTS